MNNDALVSFFQNLRLPLRRKGADFYSFIENHLAFFNKELDSLLNKRESKTVFGEQVFETLRSERHNISEVCQAICVSLDNYRRGFVGDASNVLEQSLNKIEGRLLQSEIRGQGILNRYCRVRSDKGNARSDLFHVPFSEIAKIKAYRYSIAGYPCLYLAGSKCVVNAALSLCWFECGMPNQFYWSEFQVNPTVEAINLVDFTPSPFFNAINLSGLYTSALNNVRQDHFIVNMMFTYPIMAACSVIVSDKKQNFNPEYVIPQMFLSWIRKSTKLRGVAYFSCVDYGLARNYSAFNVAIPPVDFNQVGHCQTLKKEFLLSFPQKINVSDLLKGIQENYDVVRDFREKLSTDFRYYATEALLEMRSLCDSWMAIFESIQLGKVNDMQVTNQLIETLCLTAQRMTESEFKTLTLRQLHRDSMDTADNLLRCEGLLQDFIMVNNSIQSLRTFDLKYFPVPQDPEYKLIDEPD